MATPDKSACATTTTSFGIVVTFALAISFFEAVAQNSMKYYVENKAQATKLLVGLGIAGYVMVSLLLLTCYSSIPMGSINLVWSCISILAAYGMGYLLFNEEINQYTIYSVALALGAIYMGSMG